MVTFIYVVFGLVVGFLLFIFVPYKLIKTLIKPNGQNRLTALLKYSAIWLVGLFGSVIALDVSREPLDRMQKEAEAEAKIEAAEQAKKDQAKAEERKRKEEIKKAEEEAKAKAKELGSFFSGWDGSNPELVKLVKANMNDPDSFEHVETRFSDDGDTYHIVMTFRGKNAFNGTITQRVVARINKKTREITEAEIVQ